MAERCLSVDVAWKADAAHLCNPFGGLGLTGGIVDGGNLFDCLIGIHKGLATDSILDRYNEVRRQQYRDFIDPVSSANMALMWQEPDKLYEENGFLKQIREARNDPELMGKLQTALDAIMHDFTQEYKQPAEGE